MGRRRLTPEEREAAREVRLAKAREAAAKYRKENPEICKARVQASLEKNAEVYKESMKIARRTYYLKKKAERQATVIQETPC